MSDGILAQAKGTVQAKGINISLADSLLGIVFALAGFSLFLPDTSLTVYGYAVSDYAFLASVAALAIGWYENDTSRSLSDMGTLDTIAAAGTGVILLGYEYIPQFATVIQSEPLAQGAALVVTMTGWFVVAIK
jgi:hypothetical protein